MLVVVAVVSFLGALAAAPSPATAAKVSVLDVTCNAGGTLSFSPPLTPTGTPGRHEKIVLAQTFTACSGGPGTNLPTTPQSVKTKSIKLPAAILGGEKVVGSCQLLGPQLAQVPVKQTVRWSTAFRQSKFDFVSRLMEEEGIFYFFEHDDGKHTLITLGLGAASSRALTTCMGGTAGPLTSLTFDRNVSSMTQGSNVLTTGGVGGTKVAVGDVLSSDVVGGPNCASANAQASVESNPLAPGTAAIQVTGLTFNNCSIDMGPAVGTLPAVVVVDTLPLSMSVGDSSGDPATLSAVDLTISVNGGGASCSYASTAPVVGAYDNGTSSVDFGGSTLAFAGGTGSLGVDCPTSPLEAPSFTSVVDSSQSGSPAVFAN